MTALVNSVADQTTFVAGNVFYQVLFSQMRRDAGYEWLNWIYFGSASLSLLFGITAIFLASMLSIWGSDFDSPVERDEFALHTIALQAALIQFYNASIFTWVFSFTFLASVNFPHYSWMTVVCGAGCLGSVVLIWAKTRREARLRTTNRGAGKGKGARGNNGKNYDKYVGRGKYRSCIPLRQYLCGPIRLYPRRAFVAMVAVLLLHLVWQFLRMLLIVFCAPLCGMHQVSRLLPTEPLSRFSDPLTKRSFDGGRKLAAQYEAKHREESAKFRER